MTSFRRILVATDYSPASERAMQTAAALATRFGATLAVIHVVEESAYANPFPMPRGVRDAAKERLDGIVAGLRARLLDATGVLREGVACDEICAAAGELPTDLLVIGSQGRRGLPRFVMGSVAERVVRMSPRPVLTVHPSDHVAILAGGMDRFRRILAPTDFSEASLRGIDVAVDLALELEASLTIAHVFELPSPLYEISLEAPKEAEAQVRRELDALLARVRARLPEADGALRQGAPWQGILDIAGERGAELVVLSTHGRRGLQRALIGSVAEKIVRLAPVPVLTIGPS